ncbi:MAG: PIN domain-containing protein [Leptolyngbya sp. SIOISBB]|nr:PIN domain-containing protein [Leptolyngbya sp. SIOISBB]
MTLPPDVLVDTGLLVAFYDAADRHHDAVVDFFTRCTARLITTVGCVTEVMWLLSSNWQVQNEFLNHLARGVYVCKPLLAEDFDRIVELNKQYADLPGDFSDLALIAISERLNVAAIATLDKDFDIYRRYRKEFFNRVFRP